MKNRFIGFRFRKQLDDDIHTAVKDLDGDSLSEIARTGLRMALGIYVISQQVLVNSKYRGGGLLLTSLD